MPHVWEEGTLSNIADITSGKRPPSKENFESNQTPYPIIGASSVMGYTSEYMYSNPILVIGRVGTHGIVQRLDTKCWPSDNTLVIKSSFYEYVFQILKRIDYSSINRGSTQPLITQSDIRNTLIGLPSTQVLHKFEIIVSSIYHRVNAYKKESTHLAALRDALLPKLMSGELKPQ